MREYKNQSQPNLGARPPAQPCIHLNVLPDIWAGWIDEEQEGLFQNPGTDKALTDSMVSELFYPGQPNGGRGENCAYIKDWIERKPTN